MASYPTHGYLMPSDARYQMGMPTKKVTFGRKAALITSGVLLLLCGAAMMALPFYMAQLPEKALQKACQRVILNTNTTTRGKCATGNPSASTALTTNNYSLDNCKADVKYYWGCTCNSHPCTTPSSFAKCDLNRKTNGKQNPKYYLAELTDRWEAGMWSTGAAGIFVTIVVLAIPAFIGAVYGDSSTACYSVMCGILFLPLLFVGACFATIAVGLSKHLEHLPVWDLLKQDCNNQVDMPFTVNSSTTLHCGRVVVCNALHENRSGESHQIMASAAVAAVAWSLAGLICFIGTFLCCCCKDILSTAPKLIPQSMGNPPGNVPPPPAHKLMQAPSPPVTYAMPAPQPAMMMYPEPPMQPMFDVYDPPMYEQPMYEQPMYEVDQYYAYDPVPQYATGYQYAYQPQYGY